MARKIIFLWLLVLAFQQISKANSRPWDGLSMVIWTPGPSDIYLSNDNGASGQNGGISPLYSPEMSASQNPLRAVGNIPAREIVGGRLTLSSSQGFAGVSKTKLYQYVDNKSDQRNESLDPQAIQLGGYHLVILYPFSKAVALKPYFATTEGSNSLAYRIDDDTVTAFQAAIKSQTPFSTAGFKFIPTNQVMIRYGTVDKNEYAGLNAGDYLKAYASLLTKYGVRYESIMFVQGSSTVCQGGSGLGDYLPAIFVPYGKKSLAYAMYGVWHDDAKAREYGYAKDQKVYFSEKTMLPDNDSYAKYPDVAILQLAPSMRYGKQVFSEEEILKNKNKYFSLLAWRPFKAWSEMDSLKQYDADGNVKPIVGTEEYPPNAPDNTDNTNGPGMTDCPDRDWYWDLFCQCIGNKLKTSEETTDSKKFQDYKDYLGVQSMSQQYDPTVYGMDKSTSPQTIETENQPMEPAIYNKNCELLNGKEVQLFDPFAPDADFYLWHRYWDWTIGHMGYFKKASDVTEKFRQCLSNLQHVFDYFVTNKGNETSWGYTKVGSSYYKKWQFEGDVEISIEKPEYLDSSWYLANALANYAPFETYRQFAVYDNFSAQGTGPFCLLQEESIFRDDNQTDVPEYKRKKKGMTFTGVNYEFGVPENKKDWYVQWKYNLVYKDKYDRKFSVGTLTFTTALWKNENENVMPALFDWNGSYVNGKLYIGGKTPFTDPTTSYSKNSKDYRTDQTDPGDRSEEAKIDKGEALWEIARKIAVAELFDLATKTVYNISKRNDQYGTAAMVSYEASKRLENYMMVRKTFEMAKDVYKGYVYWRETMDIIADCRDTYNSISAAWDGLRTSALGLYDYYKNLDFKKIRLTNITRILPGSYLYDVDVSLYCLQSSLANFNKSLDALAFQSDRLTRGNYGPFNPVILYVTSELMQATGQSGEVTTRFLTNTSDALNQVTRGAGNNPANKAYLSNITKATYNTITNQRLLVMNERNRSAALGLFILQQEANDWVAYQSHMKYAAGNVVDWSKQASKNNFYPIIAGFQKPPGMFKDQGYWDALAQSGGK